MIDLRALILLVLSIFGGSTIYMSAQLKRAAASNPPSYYFGRSRHRVFVGYRRRQDLTSSANS